MWRDDLRKWHGGCALSERALYAELLACWDPNAFVRKGGCAIVNAGCDSSSSNGGGGDSGGVGC